MHAPAFRAWIAAWALLASLGQAAAWPEVGSYAFQQWAGPTLPVHYAIPPDADRETPILIVLPGARRNAETYRDQWRQLALANRRIVLVPEAVATDFPGEYAYNLGGLTDPQGNRQPREQQLFSAIEPMFDDFCKRFGSSRATYGLYGHSAGGQFVHLFLLHRPKARVHAAVAANPAFFTLPNQSQTYPFGLAESPADDGAVDQWLSSPLVVLLGDRDLNPRTKPLSNGPEARRQGPHVFARGLLFYQAALAAAKARDVPLAWRLEIVQNVGHSNAHMASHALKYLLD